jgi:hypothetical protein
VTSPVYVPTDDYSAGAPLICQACGALVHVYRTTEHDRWHWQQDAVRKAVLKLTGEEPQE